MEKITGRERLQITSMPHFPQCGKIRTSIGDTAINFLLLYPIKMFFAAILMLQLVTLIECYQNIMWSAS